VPVTKVQTMRAVLNRSVAAPSARTSSAFTAWPRRTIGRWLMHVPALLRRYFLSW